MTSGSSVAHLDVPPPHRHNELRSMGSGHTRRERVRPGGTGIVRLHVADLRRSTGHRSGSLSSPVVPEASCWQRPSVVLVQQSSPHTRHPRLRHGPARSAWLSSPPRRGRITAGATQLRYRKAQLRDNGRDTASGSRPPGCVPCRPPLRLRRRDAGQGTGPMRLSPSPAGPLVRQGDVPDEDHS